MQDRKALQAGTSHFLGQNFAVRRAINISRVKVSLSTSDNFVGVSTRLIGGMIMTHGDDNGMVTFALAPSHVVIMPIFRDAEQEKMVWSIAMKSRRSCVRISCMSAMWKCCG